VKEDIKKMVHQWAADNEVALPSWKSNSLIDRIEDLFNDLRKGSGHHVESLPLTWDKSLEETFDESKENPDDELQDSIQRVKVPHGWIYMLQGQMVFVPEFAEMQPEIHDETQRGGATLSLPGMTLKAAPGGGISITGGKTGGIGS